MDLSTSSSNDHSSQENSRRSESNSNVTRNETVHELVDFAELEQIVECNSQNYEEYPARSLIDCSGSWRTDSWVDKASITIKTKDEVLVQGFKIASDGAAFVEVYVARTREFVAPNEKRKFRLILSRSSLMTPLQSSPNKFEAFRLKERRFDYDLLHEQTRKHKWDLFKFVCTQTFNKHVSYGLHSVHIITKDETSVEDIKPVANLDLGMFRLRQRDDTNKGNLKVGYFFAKRQRHESNSSNGDDYDHSSLEQGTSKRLATDSDNISTTNDTSSPDLQLSPLESRDEQISRNDAGTSRRTPTARVNLSRRLNDTSDTNIERDTHESIVCVVQPVNYDTSDVSRDNNTSVPGPAEDNNGTVRMRKKIYPKILPYDKIMDGVFFVLSGFINPLRSQLRDLAINMGAKYERDWSSRCTHLICAFKRTPKYNEVISHNGRIMREHWVAECAKERKLLDWRKYKLGDYLYPDSEEEDI